MLATTELQKVPETVVSRCQSFTFRRFSTSEIVTQLDKILTTELKRRKLVVPEDDRAKILDLVARSAEGGMRDAQVTLDQVLVFSRERLDYDSVRRFLGTVEAEVLEGFVRALHERRADDLLLQIEELTSTGQDLELFVKNLSDYVRDLLILRTAPGKPQLVTAAPDRHVQLRDLAGSTSAAFLLNVASATLKLSEEMKGSSQARFLLEFAVIRLTKVDLVDDISQIQARLQELEKRVGGGGGGNAPSGGGGGGGEVAAPQAPAQNFAPVASVQPQAVAPAPMRRESVNQEVSTPTAVAVMPDPVVVASPAVEVGPETVAPSAPAAFDSASPLEFQKRLLEAATARNAYGLRTTLLETCLVSLSDSAFVLGAKSSDGYTLAHLDTGHNQAMLREIALEITGRELSLRVQPVQEMHLPFSAVAAPGQPIPAAASPRSQPPVVASVSVTPSTPRAEAGPPAAVAAKESDRGASEEEPAPRKIIFTADLRNASKAPVKGQALRQLLEKHSDLQELVDKVKAAFHVDDAQITFLRSIV